MTTKDLFRCIGNLSDGMIEEAADIRRKPRWLPIAALAACCLIAVGLARLVTLGMGNTSDSTAALDAAAPETAMMQATEEAKSGSAENGALKSEGADDMMDAAANDAEAPAETEDAETTTDTPADSVVKVTRVSARTYNYNFCLCRCLNGRRDPGYSRCAGSGKQQRAGGI